MSHPGECIVYEFYDREQGTWYELANTCTCIRYIRLGYCVYLSDVHQNKNHLVAHTTRLYWLSLYIQEETDPLS